MDNEYQRLSRELQSSIDILRRLDGESPGDAVDDAPPHVEKIDLDHLCELLDRVRDRLHAAQQLDTDTATVRQWLIGRIESLQRGRRALVQERRIDQDMSSLETASLGELIRCFENTTASVRTSAHTGTIGSRRFGRGCQEFKS